MADIRIATRCLEEDLTELPRSVQAGVLGKIEGLAENPQWGKPLHEELSAYRSLPYARDRIIYRYDVMSDVVWIVAIGIRKEGSKQDIYRRALKLLKAGKRRLYFET
jgi:mRNA interferase RelE/StbE